MDFDVEMVFIADFKYSVDQKRKKVFDIFKCSKEAECFYFQLDERFESLFEFTMD